MIRYAIEAVRYWAARLQDDERGQDVVEYALLTGLIAVALVAVAAAGVLTGAVDAMASGISACIDFNGSTACAVGLPE